MNSLRNNEIRSFPGQPDSGSGSHQVKAAILQLGPDRKHFVGVVLVDVKAGTPVVIRRVPDSDTYRMTVLDDRKPNMSEENRSAFIPSWILRGDDEPPAKQTNLFEING